MGVSSSVPIARCDPNSQPNESFTKDAIVPMEPPPAMRRPQSFEQRMFDKFTKQPLVPIGCAATVYFLASGIKSFQKRDPRRAQKMMRMRVGAQFATLAIFVYYVGFDNINFEIAPAYYRAKEEEEKNKSQEAGSSSN